MIGRQEDKKFEERHSVTARGEETRMKEDDGVFDLLIRQAGSWPPSCLLPTPYVPYI